MSQFNSISLGINRNISKENRKRQGIYFTPLSIRQKVCNILEKLEIKPSSILEPSFGSGEFLDDMNRMFPKAKLFGVEKNEEIFDLVVKSVKYPVNLRCIDFLEYIEKPVELVIGNPPYFVTQVKNPECMSGRGNMFVLFIYKCLTEHLSDKGILAFVLSTSFYNCLYYQKCREYISRNCTVLHLENLDGNFYETSQDTMLMVLRKEKSVNDNYIYKINNAIYLSAYYKELREISESSTTLEHLGYRVKTGTVVWNQHKNKLSNDKGILLLYSSNIDKDGNLSLGNLGGDKKQYISGLDKNTEKGPSILIARGYGNSYQFRYIVVDFDEYYVENHLNIIYRFEGCIPTETITKSLEREETKKFIRYFVGNGALSKSELEKVFPIFLDK